MTKTVAFPTERVGDSESAMFKSTFLNSLKKLKLESVYGLLIHDARDLECDSADSLFETLLELKESGEVKKIGLSVYNEAQIDMVLDNYPIDIIQLQSLWLVWFAVIDVIDAIDVNDEIDVIDVIDMIYCDWCDWCDWCDCNDDSGVVK